MCPILDYVVAPGGSKMPCNVSYFVVASPNVLLGLLSTGYEEVEFDLSWEARALPHPQSDAAALPRSHLGSSTVLASPPSTSLIQSPQPIPNHAHIHMSTSLFEVG